MPNVVHQKIVAIVPAAHVELLHRCEIVMPERLVRRQRAQNIIAVYAKNIFYNVELQRLKQQSLPVIARLFFRGVKGFRLPLRPKMIEIPAMFKARSGGAEWRQIGLLGRRAARSREEARAK